MRMKAWKNYLSLLILLVVFSAPSWVIAQAQGENGGRKHRHYNTFALQDAIKYYNKLVRKQPENGEALFNLADSYRLNGEYLKAEKWFRRAVKIVDEPDAHLYFAQMLLSNGKYLEAEQWFNSYAKMAPNTDDAESAKLLAEYARHLHENGLPDEDFHVYHCKFNSKKIDFSPMYFGGPDRLVFASSRDVEEKRIHIDNWTSDRFVDLFVVEKDSLGTWQTPKIMPEPINSKFHEGSMVFTKDMQMMFFTRNDYYKSRGYDSNRNTRLHIYSVYLDTALNEEGQREWTGLKALEFNSKEYSCAHPTLTNDDKVMVFSSDQPGGFGGMDLYMVQHNGADWGEPVNMGDQLNTSGNEVFPYIHPQTNDLYFSSNLHVGLGGLDIFRAKWNPQTKVWSHPVNVGLPLNSNRDDFGLIANADFSKGYFTSNRAGKDDDIYSFTRKKEVKLEGVVVDCRTGEPIEAANVVIIAGGPEGLEEGNEASAFNGTFTFNVSMGQDYLVKATKEGYSICGDCDGTRLVRKEELDSQLVVKVELPVCLGPGEDECQLYVEGIVYNRQTKTALKSATVKMFNRCTGDMLTFDTDDKGYYKFAIDDECDYVLMGNKENFTDGRAIFSSKGKKCDDPNIQTEIPLDLNPDLQNLLDGGVVIAGMVIELEHIYFDLDKYYIRADAIQDLEDLLDLLQTYPEMTGEIGAHTDSRAPFKYNETLSDNRAKSAVTWLVNRGIDPSRLTWKGYGEYRLKNHCSDDIECSEFDHQRNRRVEFTVTYVGKKVLSKEKQIYRNNRRRRSGGGSNDNK